MTKKRLRSLIAFSVLMAVLLGGGLYLRNFLATQLKKRIQSYVNYDRVHLHLFPPSIIFEDLRTVSLTPFFSAKRVYVELPYSSIFKSQKPLIVVVEKPVVRISPSPPEEEVKKEKKPLSLPSLPFAIDRGLVVDGEVYYWGEKTSYQAKGIKALIEQEGNAFSFKGEVAENVINLDPKRIPLEGRISLSFQARGNEITIQRFVLANPDLVVKAKGKVTNPANPEIQLDTFFDAEMKVIDGLLRFPFDWEGRVQGNGKLDRMAKEIKFRTQFSTEPLLMNTNLLGTLEGKATYIGGKGGEVRVNVFQQPGGPGVFKVNFGGGLIVGDFEKFYPEPVASSFKVSWPVRSPVYGRFVLDAKTMTSNFEFRDDAFEMEGGKYPFRGPVEFTWDKVRDVSFSSPRLETTFATMEVNGRMSVMENVDVSIKAQVTDIKSGREFLTLVRRKELRLPEIRGEGKADVVISGEWKFPQLNFDFDLSPCGFDKFDFARASGIMEFYKGTAVGKIQVNDPDLKAEINLLSGKDGLDVETQLEEGEVQKILPGFNIHVPLKGRSSGYFHIRKKEADLRIDGLFSSPLLQLGNQEFSAASGKLNYDGDFFSLTDLSAWFYGGEVNGYSKLGFKSRMIDLDLEGKKIDLSAFNPQLKGELFLTLSGKGPLGQDMASGKFDIQGLRYGPLRETDTQGEVKLSLIDSKVSLDVSGNFSPGENDFTVSVTVPPPPEPFSAEVKGKFQNLDLILPWKGAEGEINYLAEIKGGSPSPRLDGVIDFQGPLLPFPRFAHALTDYSGLVFIQNNTASIRSFNGKLGGGDVQGTGEIRFGKGEETRINFNFEGRDMLLSPVPQTRALTDGSVRLIKDSNRFSLEGSFYFNRVSWRRELTDKIVFSSGPSFTSQWEMNIFDVFKGLTLDIRLRADDNAWMENSLGRLRGKFDLTISGNVKAPIITGEIETLGGEVYFQDRKFQILQGRVGFFNPAAVEPYLDFKGETYVKDYRVTFSLVGPISQLRPDFSSSPPLPTEDVLALLALGEAFKRPYSAETSTQMSTASFLSFQLTEEAQKRAERLFVLDRIRIDPFLMGSSAEMTARLTVGKKISKDFFIYYSTNLTTQREEIIRLEWDIRNDLSIIGTRDELGRLSFDVKIRKRF